MTLFLAVCAALFAGSTLMFFYIMKDQRVAPLVETTSGSALDRREQIGQQLSETKGWNINDEVKADLWLTAKAPNRFLYERFLSLVALTGVGFVMGLLLGGAFIQLLLTGLGSYVGWILPRKILAQEVSVKRQEILAALAFWAELIAASVGGSKAVGIAAKTSAERGDGWAWDLFRDSCNRADSTADTLPTLLRRTAASAAIPELAVFAESIEAATERGAVVRDAMDEQAEILRGKVHDLIKLHAGSRSNAMIVPVGLAFTGFIGFLFFIVIDSLTIAF